MKPLDRLSDYLVAVERRLRLMAVTRGVAATAAAALIFTLVAVLLANFFAFSKPSVTSARFLLFFGVAFALAAALVYPLIRLNRRRAAREAETRYPQFEERLLTLSERMEQNPGDPFLPLLADDTLSVAQHTEPKKVAKSSWLFGFSSAAVVSMLVLLWLGLYGPGFLGYGTSLLWGGSPKAGMKPFYDIEVQPGNHTVKKRANETITARLIGFTAPKVRLFGKYSSSSQWDPVEMRTQADGTAYEFVIPGLLESLDYYVEAGGVRSKTFKLTVMDLPAVKSMTTTYHYPSWTGLPDFVQNPGGDLRAVEGTIADVEIKTDKPLANGALVLDDGSKIPLHAGPNGSLVAKVPIQKDGQYNVAAIENGEDVRLTEDYFIEAQKYHPPEVKITRPGRDFRASPIEEVTITAEAKDDFALKNVDLHYSVNGGEEKTVSLLQQRNGKSSTGSMTLALEDFKLQPGDIVSFYAEAKDARSNTRTDMFFIEAQPFERNYTQSQQGGGGGGGGGAMDEQNQLSQRQKEIIAATWNEMKGSGATGTEAENAAFLSQVQSKLRDQAKSLSDRMKSRQLSDAGDSFKTFVNDMDQATAAMGPASDKLKGANWKDALGPEEKALQHLEHAESVFRDIQIAFGNQGGGGGGGAQGGARDLEGLFDLELDTEKNQFESAPSMQSADQMQKQIDDALQKLDQLAKRQQDLADQQHNPQTLAQKRYEQEMLRRQAEQLQQQLDQLQRQAQNQQSQQGQQGQQSQQGQPGQQGQQSSSQSGQSGQGGSQGQIDSQRMQQTVQQLQQALDNMRQAASSQQAGTPQSEADARRAAEQLKQAEQTLSSMRREEAGGKLDDLAHQADDLAQRQQNFEGQLRRAVTGGQSGNQGQQEEQPGPFGRRSLAGGRMSQQQAQQLSDDRAKETADLKRLEQEMQNTVRDLAGSQPKASSQLREALGQAQQQELPRDMERNGQWIRQGMADYAVLSEPTITQGINNLRDQLHGVQQAMDQNKDGKGAGDDKENKAVEETLNKVESLRQQIEALQQRQGQNQNGQNGQDGQSGQQQGNQSGQAGGAGNQGGYQQGSLNRNGQPPNGPNGGATISPNGGANYGLYGGYWYGNPNGPVRADVDRNYRETLNQLDRLQGQLQNDPDTLRDLQSLIREMQRMNPFTGSNDAELSGRIQAAMVADIEHVELELRRKVDEATSGGSTRSAGAEPIPQGYADAVAEYFRRLSSSTPNSSQPGK
jgi:hypothetical protein